MSKLEPIMRQNFLEYASYVIMDRAIPDIRDGCKPVQRRLLWTLRSMHDGKFHKVANVIGETMKLHPHGDASIGAALVVLANKDYFIEKQGNFGSVLTGHPAAASRYIECRLTDLAVDTLFNKNLTDFVPSYDGRKDEPVFLPVKLPVVLLLGTEGIAVGMSTKILPHNLGELLKAQIKILQNKPFRILPDFPAGGLADVSDYARGKGKVKCRAKIEVPNDKSVVITELPYGVTTESLIASIEAAVQKNKVKIAGIDDFTAEKVEIRLALSRGTYADEVVPQLYAHTDCEVNVSSNIVVIHNNRPVEWTVNDVLKELTSQLLDRLRAELKWELKSLLDKQHWLTLEQIFIENKVYKALEKANTSEKVVQTVYRGMKKFESEFVRAIDDDDVERLLKIHIRRISAYDIEKHRKDIGDIVKAIKEVRKKLRDMTQTTIGYLQGLVDKYAKRFTRRTQITTFESIDKRDVARQNIKMSYDPKTGFFGTQIKGGEHAHKISEYDRLLLISKDGTYRIIGEVDKLLVNKLLYCEPYDEENGAVFTVVYRDKKKKAWAKKIHIDKYIRNREYRLIKEEGGQVDVLTPWDPPGQVELQLRPAPRQKVKSIRFDLTELDFVGVTTRGTALSAKPVSKVIHHEEDS